MREWLLFLPQTPASPSSLRVSVWRKMQQLGAITLQNGVWILPRSNQLERKLSLLLADLKMQGGEGLILIAKAPHTDLEGRITEQFSAARTQEYVEFTDRCKQFLGELEKETKVQKFTFAELEENEEDLHKLVQWLRKIHQRDFLGGVQRDTADNALARCRHSLEIYTKQVYHLLEYDPPESLPEDEEKQQGP
jgi:DNA-binding transcriptional regulator PaaX